MLATLDQTFRGYGVVIFLVIVLHLDAKFNMICFFYNQLPRQSLENKIWGREGHSLNRDDGMVLEINVSALIGGSWPIFELLQVLCQIKPNRFVAAEQLLLANPPSDLELMAKLRT